MKFSRTSAEHPFPSLHAFAVINCHHAFIFVYALDDLLRKWKVCEQGLAHCPDCCQYLFSRIFLVYSTDPGRIKAEGDLLLYGNVGDLYLVK